LPWRWLRSSMVPLPLPETTLTTVAADFRGAVPSVEAAQHALEKFRHSLSLPEPDASPPCSIGSSIGYRSSLLSCTRAEIGQITRRCLLRSLRSGTKVAVKCANREYECSYLRLLAQNGEAFTNKLLWTGIGISEIERNLSTGPLTAPHQTT
jgi:hypothetical protein